MKSLVFIFTLSFSINAYALKDCSSLFFWKEWNNCEGSVTLPDGAKYVGEWKDSKWHGQGTLTFPSGQKYVGEWKDDKRNGQGTFFPKDGEAIYGFFLEGDHIPTICGDMGFLESTEAFGNCVFRLIDKIN